MIAALLLLLPIHTVTPDVVYARVAGEELAMDIYQPAALSREPRPAVVALHGGAWMSGTRKHMARICEAIAAQGMVAATASYRLAPKHKWPAMLDDAKASVRFLRANAAKYNLDPKRIGATGVSAGGHLALFLGFIDE